MFLKNTASQHVGAQMVSATDGSALTSAVTVKVTLDGGTYSDGGGTATHKGGGQWDYQPTQAETNGEQVSFQFNHATGIPVTVNVYTIPGDVYARIGTPAGDSISADIAGVTAGLGTIVPTTDAPDAEVVAAGTVIAGSYVNCQTDDNNRYTTAPVNPGGLDVELDFTITGSRAPVSLSVNGYFNGSGQAVDVYALDAEIDYWDKLTNTSTRMASRTSETNYSFPLNREHIDPDTGVVKIRFVSASTNTAHRLYLDRVLVGTVDISTGQAPSISAQDIWTYPSRELTTSTGEPVDADAIAAAVRDVDNTTPAENSLGAKINSTAPASTALTNATWTDAKAGYIDQAISTKRAVTLATADVTGNLPADVKAWNGGALPTIGTSTLTAQQVWEYATRTLSAFGFSVTVGTNNDKTGYALTAVYDPAKTAAQAATALSNATWTDAKAAFIDQAISAKRAATLAAADVTGNLPADVKAWDGGSLPTIGSSTGAIEWAVTIVDDNSNPIADVDVSIRSEDDADATPVATGKTDAFGVVVPTPMLDAGTYYVWRQKTGTNFTNPATIVVS